MNIRSAKPSDLAQLIQLCIEHAQYERADIGNGPSEVALYAALFGTPPRLLAWVAANDRDELVGFASATLDFATWTAREFVHMDCLFICEHARGSGLGGALVEAVIDAARALGVTQLQWQTPNWNESARRFYARLGASSRDKARYTLELR